jgi:lactate dehydrogenase-like 2-hydroxyacid dehydrogenase
MSGDKPVILLAPGLGGLRRPFESLGEVLDLPKDDLAGFLAGPAKNARALVTTGSRPVEPQIATLTHFGLVAVIGSGYEAIDVKGLRMGGVDVTNSPNANHEDVADHAVGLMLMEVRKLAQGDRVVRAGQWEKNKHPPPTRSVRTLKVGVVGLGAIGLAIAERLKGFGCEIAWWGPRPKPDAPFTYVDSLETLATRSDVLMVAHRADDSNRGLISRAVIEAVGPRGVIVNISRGSAIDEDALIAALKDGRLGGAALDVFEAEPTPAERWRDVPNVVLTPHTAGGGDASLKTMVAMAFDNVSRFLAGVPVANPVPN